MTTLYLPDTLVMTLAATMLVPAALLARAANELRVVRRAIRERRARKHYAD